MLTTTVQDNARKGRQPLTRLLAAREGKGSDWPEVSEALTVAPGWAVTSLSARRFPPDAALFDLVIVDEASQCAIPHVLPLLFRARRALIIGDAMQLPHISTLSTEQEESIRRTTGLRAGWLERNRLSYRRHSAFHAAERSTGQALLLDEHFRCHPDIAALSNRLFYGDHLTILTDARHRPALERRAIIWAPVSGHATRPPSGSSWSNPEEVKKVTASVEHLLDHLPAEATIGVITPFKAQEEQLKQQLAPYGERIRTGTIHTFQGGERDVILLSLVAGKGMHQGAFNWINRQLNLWNVAITRARSHLIVVGDRDRWTRSSGIGAALAQAADDEAAGRPTTTHQELHQRLFTTLNQHTHANVELATMRHGHPVDAVVHTNEATTAVLLDPGPTAQDDPARHLRVKLRQQSLVDDGNTAPAIRMPAWRLY